MEESLERVLSREYGYALPYAHYVSPDFLRLIEAGWAWRRMSLAGYWIVGWTDLGHAAATLCGIADRYTR